MQRRRYLALASSFCLAGCLASKSPDQTGPDADTTTNPNSGPPPQTEPDDRSATDEAEWPKTIDDFEDFDRWDVVGGRLTADPDRAVVGSRSARLEVPAARHSAGVAKSFPKPRDFTEFAPGVAVATDGLVGPWIRLIDADGDSIAYRRRIGADVPLMRYNFGVETVDSGFDPTAVSEVWLQVWTAEGERRTVWFDDLHLTPRPSTGKVMIQFDDGSATDYTEALPLLEEYGYPAVSFVNAASIGGGGKLTIEQLRELDEAGWCIANHTASHARLSDHGAAEQEAEIREGKQWLVDRGFEDGADYFAYPFGDYDATTIELVDG